MGEWNRKAGFDALEELQRICRLSCLDIARPVEADSDEPQRGCIVPAAATTSSFRREGPQPAGKLFVDSMLRVLYY